MKVLWITYHTCTNIVAAATPTKLLLRLSNKSCFFFLKMLLETALL